MTDEEIKEKLFGGKEAVFRNIRDHLQTISASERRRFPSVYFYLAFVHAALEDYRQAAVELKQFIALVPDNQTAYALACGLLNALLGINQESDRQLRNELIDLCIKKCEDRPTEQDCYRAGYLMCVMGDCEKGSDYIRFSAFLGPDPRSRIAIGVIAALNSDGFLAQATVESFRSTRNDLSGETQACYYMLMAVLAAQQGNPTMAEYWANEAVKPDDRLPQASDLLDAIRNR